MQQSGYSTNKDNRALEEERVKRQKEEQVRKEKDKLRLELSEKKRQLVSTTGFITRKTTDLRTNELKLNKLKADILNAERTMRTLQAQFNTTDSASKRLEAEERANKSTMTPDQLRNLRMETSRSAATITSNKRQEEQSMVKEEVAIKKTAQEIEVLSHQLDVKKTELSHLKEEQAKEKVALERLTVQETTIEGKMKELQAAEKGTTLKATTHAELDRDKKEAARIQTELQKMKTDIERMKSESLALDHQITAIKGEVAQLTANKTTLDAETRRLESQTR